MTKPINPDGTPWSDDENPSGMTKKERKDARRTDRKQARADKAQDIADGESRKQARDDKHAEKSADRQKWEDGKYSIGQSMHYNHGDEVG